MARKKKTENKDRQDKVNNFLTKDEKTTKIAGSEDTDSVAILEEDAEEMPKKAPKAKAKSRPKKEAVPETSKGLRLNVKQFTIAQKLRWERTAGFIHWANKKLGKNHRLTVKEWQPVYEDFMNRPVR